MNSDTADNLLWDQLALPAASRPAGVASALSRITFRTESTPAPLRHITELAKAEVSASSAQSEKTLIVFAGRSRRLAAEVLGGELRALTGELGLGRSVDSERVEGCCTYRGGVLYGIHGLRQFIYYISRILQNLFIRGLDYAMHANGSAFMGRTRVSRRVKNHVTGMVDVTTCLVSSIPCSSCHHPPS